MEPRETPHNPEAEQSVLGAMLISAEAVDVVAPILSPSDFYEPQHQDIYRAMLKLRSQSKGIDHLTVTHELGSYEHSLYLMDISGSIPTASNAQYWAEIVREKAEARRVIQVGSRIIEAGYDPQTKDPLDLAASLVMEACTKTENAEVQSLAEIADPWLQQVDAAMVAWSQYQGERIPGRILTHHPAIDRINQGAGLDHLVIIAARPAMGKSALLLDLAKKVSLGYGPVLFCSLEMGRQELMSRLACSAAGVDGSRVIDGSLYPDERQRLEEQIRYLSGIPLFIDDSSNLSLTRIRSQARFVKARYGGLAGVFVDYLQLMGATSEEVSRYKRGESAANRQEEVAKISRSLKMLAKEMGCPVFAASQLSRSLESRSEKRPMLSDLRESGAIEQDANQVWFLYRDEYYNPESPDKNVCEVIIAKNRGGRQGTAKLGFERETTTFFSLEPKDHAPMYDEPGKARGSWQGTQLQEFGEEFG